MTASTLHAPAQLDHAGIAARVPHAGRMCLLGSLVAWSAEHIHCRVTGHSDPAHPLRSASGLLAPCAIEYAGRHMDVRGQHHSRPDTRPSDRSWRSAGRARSLKVC